MKHVLFILNPTAGKRKAAKLLPEILSIFNQADYDLHTYITSKRGDATEAVKKYGDSVDLIICCGGDGTYNETLTGLLESDLHIPVGYIPAGSTNDLANSLKLSNNVLKAAEQIVNGTPKEYDIGKFQDRFFSYVASFGLFTKASYSTSQTLKNALGHTAYILSGITELSKIRKHHIVMEIDDEVLEGDYILGAICNSTSVAGIFKLDPNLVDMRDGKFEILLLRSPKNIQELHECVVSIVNHTYKCKMITFRSASSIKIVANPDMAWTLDGEKADGEENITIENLNCRISLVH